MKPAPCSCRVRISLIDFERDRLSRKSRFSSPGTPKIYSTPSSSRHSMNRSDAFFMLQSPPQPRTPPVRLHVMPATLQHIYVAAALVIGRESLLHEESL